MGKDTFVENKEGGQKHIPPGVDWITRNPWKVTTSRLESLVAVQLACEWSEWPCTACMISPSRACKSARTCEDPRSPGLHGQRKLYDPIINSCSHQPSPRSSNFPSNRQDNEPHPLPLRMQMRHRSPPLPLILKLIHRRLYCLTFTTHILLNKPQFHVHLVLMIAVLMTAGALIDEN